MKKNINPESSTKEIKDFLCGKHSDLNIVKQSLERMSVNDKLQFINNFDVQFEENKECSNIQSFLADDMFNSNSINELPEDIATHLKKCNFCTQTYDDLKELSEQKNDEWIKFSKNNQKLMNKEKKLLKNAMLKFINNSWHWVQKQGETIKEFINPEELMPVGNYWNLVPAMAANQKYHNKIRHYGFVSLSQPETFSHNDKPWFFSFDQKQYFKILMIFHPFYSASERSYFFRLEFFLDPKSQTEKVLLNIRHNNITTGNMTLEKNKHTEFKFSSKKTKNLFLTIKWIVNGSWKSEESEIPIMGEGDRTNA